MTEKRFKHDEVIQDDGQCICWGICDTEKRQIYNMVDEIVFEVSYNQLIDVLNEQHEENEQLKHDATVLIQANQEYRKENEELKQQLQSILKLTNKIEDYTHDMKLIGDVE